MSPLSPRLRHGYGLTALALSLANTSVLFFLLKRLVDTAGLTPAQAGSVLLVGKLWDAVSDPLLGWLSDRTTHPMGSRRPWLAFGALPFALLFAALWVDLPVSGRTALLTYAALLVAYNTAYTAVVVPYGALTPVLATDYDSRTALNGVRMAWSMGGGLVAGILMPVLHGITGSWALGGAVLALAIAPLVFATVRVTRGHDRVGGPAPSTGPLWDVLRVAGFRRVVLAFVASWTTIALLGALIPFYTEHVLGRPDLLDAVFASLQLAALAAIPLVVRAAARWQKHLTLLATLLHLALVLLVLAVLPHGAWVLALALTVVAGPGVAGAHVLPWAMLPDVVAADTQAHGVDRSGAFYGMMTFAEKIATAGALGGMGWALSLGGYVEGGLHQPPGALLTLRTLMGPLPAVGLLATSFLLWRRPPSTRTPTEA